MMEIGCFDMATSMLEKLHKENPKVEMLVLKLFDAYTQNSDFFKMSGMASKLNMQFGMP